MTRDDIIDAFGLDDVVFLDGLDAGIVGVGSSADVIVYDYNRCAQALAEDGMTWDEACEWMDFNVVRACQQKGMPLMMTLLADELCAWAEDSAGVWWTGCGSGHVFETGDAGENGYKHCPYCGLRLADFPYEEPMCGDEKGSGGADGTESGHGDVRGAADAAPGSGDPVSAGRDAASMGEGSGSTPPAGVRGRVESGDPGRCPRCTQLPPDYTGEW